MEGLRRAGGGRVLTVTILRTGGTNDNASYSAWVYINRQVVKQLKITGHDRADGGAVLLQMVADAWKEGDE